MSREPDAVLSDSEEVTVQVPVTNWKDPRAYNAVLQRCQPCHAKGIERLLQNKAKAINHWAGDGTGKRDATATIRGCFEAHTVPGLVVYARQEIKSKLQAREAKEELRHQQVQKDSARDKLQDSQSGATMASGASLSQAGSGEGSVSKRRRTGDIGATLTFNNEWVSRMDRAIANLVVEEATPLALAHKPAFQELINMAIQFGDVVGANIYKHMDRRKLRDRCIPDVIKQQNSDLGSFDNNLVKFGATLVSDGKVGVTLNLDLTLHRTLDVTLDLSLDLTLDLSLHLTLVLSLHVSLDLTLDVALDLAIDVTLHVDGKDDVSKDHLINYITVCPDGYRWEKSIDVTGLRRKAEWVANDLLEKLGALEARLKARLHVTLDLVLVLDLTLDVTLDLDLTLDVTRARLEGKGGSHHRARGSRLS